MLDDDIVKLSTNAYLDTSFIDFLLHNLLSRLSLPTSNFFVGPSHFPYYITVQDNNVFEESKNISRDRTSRESKLRRVT